MKWLQWNALAVILANTFYTTESFTLSKTTNVREASTKRDMAGFGALSASKQKKRTKKGSKQAPFDVSASVKCMEKKYDEMMRASAKRIAKEDDDPRWVSEMDIKDQETITTEFMIAARSSLKKGIDDWVPIAQLCVSYPESSYHEEGNSKDLLQLAVSSYCREISYVAGLGAPLFSSVARNDVQYAAEPVDSFYKHVYEQVVEENSEKRGMSKAEARDILGLEGENGTNRSEIKKAYRKLSFELHPDRLDDNTNAEEAAALFENVQNAYEALNSGLRESGKSWYESLGGKARTEFSRIDLLPLLEASSIMEQKKISASILGLDPELVQSFVVRHLRSG